MDFFQYLNPNSEPLVYYKESLINGAGLGIFAKQKIKKNTPIIIYYGELLSTNDILNLYQNDNTMYKNDISPYLRTTGIDNMQVNGKTSENQNNLNLKGYLVNDSNSISYIDELNIKNYIENDKNNVVIVETKDFPIYYASRDILEGEELYASYGLAFWLLQCNCKPENIRKICEKFYK